jgi:hypothetical protein
MGDQSQNFNDNAGQDAAGDVVHVVDPNNSQSLGLLAKAYRDVYKPAFSPDQREAMEDWIDNMNGNNPFCDMAIVLLGENMNSKNPTLKGISVGYYYRDQDAGLFGYTVISPKYEAPGLEQAMMDTATEALQELSKKNGGQMQSVFLETNNPAKMENDDDRNEATARLQMLQSLGAKSVAVNFIEPPLAEGADKTDTYTLVAYPGKTGFLPSKDQVKDVITGLYTGLADCAGCAPKDNPDYTSIISQIDNAPQLLVAPTSASTAPVQRKQVLRFNL